MGAEVPLAAEVELGGVVTVLAAGGTAVDALGEQADSMMPLSATSRNLPLQRSNAMNLTPCKPMCLL
ncbi:MAG: hypothetical protein U1F39_14305 [Steroidobacteraceae bacterium]